MEWGSKSFAELLNQTTPRVKKIAESTLGPSPWLTSFHALILYPEPDRTDKEVRELRQSGLHIDFPYGEFKEKMDRVILGSMNGTTQGRPQGHGDQGWQFPNGFRPGDAGGPHTMQTIWILDEFTEERGGTSLYPGSFLSKRVPNCGKGRDFDEFEKHCVTQTGKAGDVLVYIGATWHTISVNRGKTPRVALLGQWSSHYMCPLEAHVWTTPSWVRDALCNDTKALMGFPSYTNGYNSESRPPHRDSAKRFFDDSIRFAWDTMIVRPGKIYTASFFILVLASTQRLYEHIWLRHLFVFLLGLAVGVGLATHAVLCRLKI